MNQIYNHQMTLKLIKAFEGCSFVPYMCPSERWTIGYGHTIFRQGRQLKGEADKPLAYVTYPEPITQEQADGFLEQDISHVVEDILKYVQVPLTKNQLSALASFVFNIGIGAFSRSTLLKKLNASDYNSVPSELNRWIKAGGKPLKGLIKRRRIEGQVWQQKDVE